MISGQFLSTSDAKTGKKDSSFQKRAKHYIIRAKRGKELSLSHDENSLYLEVLILRRFQLRRDRGFSRHHLFVVISRSTIWCLSISSVPSEPVVLSSTQLRIHLRSPIARRACTVCSCISEGHLQSEDFSRLLPDYQSR